MAQKGFDLTKWIEHSWQELLRCCFQLPFDVFDQVARTSFSASLLEDELRGIAFRLSFHPPEVFPDNIGPPEGILPLRFTEPRLCTAQELCKLAVATNFSRTALGTWVDHEGQPVIWGMLQTGPWWLRAQQGGRGGDGAVLPGFALHVTAPGSIEIVHESSRLTALERGREVESRLNVFQSHWLPDRFATIREELATLHEERRDSEDKVNIDPILFGRLTQHMLKRMIASIRAQGHGGTVLIVPQELSSEIFGDGGDIQIRTRFSHLESTARHRTLMLRAASLLATLGANIGTRRAGWEEYAEMSDTRLDQIDHALFEESYLFAALAQSDGAVVLSDRFELVGFGAEILLADIPLANISRALDAEAHAVTRESIEHMGTRHRSAARLVKKYPDVLAIVISQDGQVRFFANIQGEPTYFEHDDVQAISFVL